MKVEQRFSGDQYDIILNADATDDIEGAFELVGYHNATRKSSCITNLNIIISEIIADILPDEEIESTTLIVNDKQKFEALVENAITTLSDRDWFITHLEPALDEDREEGGWNREQP
jgi:hypothetical protein